MALAEAVVGAIVIYLLASATQFAIFPVFGLAVGTIENLVYRTVFTVVSAVRNYAFRHVLKGLRHART
jgi:hypothetical protein